MLFLSIFGLIVGLASSARADPWIWPGGFLTFTDPNPHGFCFDNSVGDDAGPNIGNAEWDALDPTNANVNRDNTCDLAGDEETDVVWFVSNLANNVKGVTSCEDVDGSYCDQHYSQIDMAEIEQDGFFPEIDETLTACHELGHTVQLEHGENKNDCMITGFDTPPTDLQYRRYSEHHRQDHINELF